MGDAKRRKDTNYQPGDERIVSWLPLTAAQSADFVRVSTQGAWIGIGLLVFGWLMVRLIGPSFGWWKIVG
jgi:Protein of unknown function (DUF2839)